MKESEYKKILHDTLDFGIYIGKNCFPKSYSTDIDADTKLKIMFSIPLVNRALHKAYSINYLLNENLLEESEIILRSLHEITFTMTAMTTDSGFMEEYINNMNITKMRNLRNLKNASQFEPCYYSLPENIDQLINNLKDGIKKENVKELKVFQIAKRAELLPLYHGVYSIICSSVHSGAEDVKEYFKDFIINKKNIIQKPEKNNYDLIQFSAIECMIHVLRSYEKVHNVNVEKIDELKKVYDELNHLIYNRYILRDDIIQ